MGCLSVSAMLGSLAVSAMWDPFSVCLMRIENSWSLGPEPGVTVWAKNKDVVRNPDRYTSLNECMSILKDSSFGESELSDEEVDWFVDQIGDDEELMANFANFLKEDEGEDAEVQPPKNALPSPAEL